MKINFFYSNIYIIYCFATTETKISLKVHTLCVFSMNQFDFYGVFPI